MVFSNYLYNRCLTGMIIALTVMAIISYDYFFFPRFTNINYFNLILELALSIFALSLLFTLQKFRGRSYFRNLKMGYYLFFVSYFVDSIDQIFIHSILFTVVLEKTTLIFAAIFIVIGSRQWIKSYEKSSLMDDLTQIPNRKLIKTILEKEILNSTKTGEPFCLVIVDIDYFKQVNDQNGHFVGDKILTAFAGRLTSFIEGMGHVGRWGGEEFLLVLKNTDTKVSLVKMNALRACIQEHPFSYKDLTIKLTASFGISQWSSSSAGFEDLFNKADVALYAAKKSGRNTVKIQ